MGRNRMNQVQVCRKFKVQSSDILWLGEASICTKQHMHYPAFLSNGKMIPVRSFVFVMHEDEERHYLGYLEDMYEERSRGKKIEVRWFCHNEEVKEVTPHLNVHPAEVFITSDIQVIGAEYVDQVGAVLSPSHYEKCLALLPDNLSSRTFLCHRQFKNKKVKPFSLRKLRGYDNQTILSLLDRHHNCSSKSEPKLQKLNQEEREGDEELPKLLTWSLRNRRSVLNKEGFSCTANSILNNQGEKYEPVRLKLFKQPRRIKLVGSKTCRSSLEEEKNIELLSQDSGIRGCWFRCKILQTSQNRIKVQYYDVQDSDKSGKLEEWVPASRVATPDKLNMRCAGRLTVRPWPPKTSLDCSFAIGDAVDAWWGDGWWESVVVGFDKSGSDNVHVFLPGENKFLTFQRKDLRTSRDWINEKWMEIKGDPEIHSFTASTIGHNMKFLELKHSAPTVASKETAEESERAVSELASDGELKSIKPEASKGDVKVRPVSVTSNGYIARNCLNPKKRRLMGC